MRSSIILCGGLSTRMKQEKGLVEYKGKSLIIHVLEAVTPEFDENILVLKDEVQFNKYQKILVDYPDLKIVFDKIPEQGPLLGIYSGLLDLKSDSAVIFPCDSPFIGKNPIQLLKKYPLDKFGALVPRGDDGRIEPLHAVYHKEKTLKAIKQLLDTDYRDVKSLYQILKVKYIQTREVDPTGLLFINLNRPQDLERIG